MTTIEKYIHNLRLQDGIWRASVEKKISYPADGNKLCFEIEDQSFWFAHRNKIICETVKKYIINGPIFDVGGGNGLVANCLCNYGFEAVLVEPGIDGCLNGKKRGLNNIVNYIIDADHFLPSSIPNIGIFDVLEHIENPIEFINTLYNMLAIGGRLFITVPAYNGLWSEEDKQAGHYYRYRKKELNNLVVHRGFNVLYSTYYYSCLVLPILIFRTLPSKFGFYKIDHKTTTKQHSANSITNIFLEMIMKYELDKIKKSKSLMFGSSLLLVAEKR